MILIQLIWMIIKAVSISIFSPLLWIVIIFILIQYRKNIELEKQILGKERNSLKEQILDSVFYGFAAGILGSIVMVFLGITIDNIGIEYVFPLAIFLMFINPRYICFSYAGGIVSIISLLTGFPSINVAGLMAVVGILHLMESMLIYIDGAVNSIPVFVQTDNGKIVGAYIMKKFWPIPFVALVTVSAAASGIDLFHMPEWWPLFRTDAGLNSIIYSLYTIIAVLGYGDIALTEMPEKRAKVSSRRLFVFSVLLILLSVGGIKYILFRWAAAIFGPLAHEFLIIKGQRDEKEKRPMFEVPDNGIMVLSVLKNSPAEQMGIKPGDIIVKINDMSVNSEEDIARILSTEPTIVWIVVKESDGSYINYEYRNYKGVKEIGILIVPMYSDKVYRLNDMENGGLIKRFFDKINKKK